MKIKKINFDQELEVTIKKVRLPLKPKSLFEKGECDYIANHSFLYRGAEYRGLYGSFFYEGVENMVECEDLENAESPYFGNPYEANGLIDLIPVIEVKESLEVETMYLIHEIPFIATTKHTLVCLTRVSWYFIGEDDVDWDNANAVIEENFEAIANW